MASAVSPLSNVNTSGTSNASSASNSSSSSNSLTNSAPSEQMFLQLLVAQIQNQDPLNPTDSTQFVSQLAQFSELEQVIAIRGDTDKLAGAGSTSSTTQDNTQTTNPSGQTTSTGQTQS